MVLYRYHTNLQRHSSRLKKFEKKKFEFFKKNPDSRGKPRNIYFCESRKMRTVSAVASTFLCAIFLGEIVHKYCLPHMGVWYVPHRRGERC